MNDWTKTPKWAQAEHNLALLKLREAKNEIARLNGKAEDSDTFVTTYGIQPDQPLGREPRVEFRMADGCVVTAHYSREEKCVSVSTVGGTMSVTPQSSNVIRIRRGTY